MPIPRLLPVLSLVALGLYLPPPVANGNSSQRRATGRQPLHATTGPQVFHGRGSLAYLSAGLRDTTGAVGMMNWPYVKSAKIVV